MPRDRNLTGKLGEGSALGSPGGSAPQQRKRRRAEGEDGGIRTPHTYEPEKKEEGAVWEEGRERMGEG